MIANRSKDTDEIDRFCDATGLRRMAHFPDLDAIRRSRLKKRTLFEMDDSDPDVAAVQKEYHAPGPVASGRGGAVPGLAHEGP